MKASEATPLTQDELKSFHLLFQRWFLNRWPWGYAGSSEESDACQTYLLAKKDAERGGVPHQLFPNDYNAKRMIAQYGENDLT